MTLDVVEISSAETHALRRAVLRDGDPTRTVVYPEDDLADTVHLGIRDANGTVVATSSWTPKPLDAFPDERAVQLRGMAIAAGMQGAGIGGLLFETAVTRWSDDGFDLVWARARDSALNFYAKHGCRVVGDGFTDDTTRLPHHIVVRQLGADVRVTPD
jgi:predicted GNAT family N-acyltransferase